MGGKIPRGKRNFPRIISALQAGGEALARRKTIPQPMRLFSAYMLIKGKEAALTLSEGAGNTLLQIEARNATISSTPFCSNGPGQFAQM